MFFLNMLTLMIAWTLFVLSDKLFPALDVSFIKTNHWWALLFLKPFSLFLSFCLFLTGALLLRRVVFKSCQQLSVANGFVRGQKYNAFVSLMIGVWIFCLVAIYRPWGATLIGGPLAIYDLSRYLSFIRKKRRLKLAFRQMKE